MPMLVERVEWNPSGDHWIPATVIERSGGRLRIELDGDEQQRVTVEQRHTRPFHDEHTFHYRAPRVPPSMEGQGEFTVSGVLTEPCREVEMQAWTVTADGGGQMVWARAVPMHRVAVGDSWSVTFQRVTAPALGRQIEYRWREVR